MLTLEWSDGARFETDLYVVERWESDVGRRAGQRADGEERAVHIGVPYFTVDIEVGPLTRADSKTLRSHIGAGVAIMRIVLSGSDEFTDRWIGARFRVVLQNAVPRALGADISRGDRWALTLEQAAGYAALGVRLDECVEPIAPDSWFADRTPRCPSLTADALSAITAAGVQTLTATVGMNFERLVQIYDVAQAERIDAILYAVVDSALGSTPMAPATLAQVRTIPAGLNVSSTLELSASINVMAGRAYSFFARWRRAGATADCPVTLLGTVALSSLPVTGSGVFNGTTWIAHRVILDQASGVAVRVEAPTVTAQRGIGLEIRRVSDNALQSRSVRSTRENPTVAVITLSNLPAGTYDFRVRHATNASATDAYTLTIEAVAFTSTLPLDISSAAARPRETRVFPFTHSGGHLLARADVTQAAGSFGTHRFYWEIERSEEKETFLLNTNSQWGGRRVLEIVSLNARAGRYYVEFASTGSLAYRLEALVPTVITPPFSETTTIRRYSSREWVVSIADGADGPLRFSAVADSSPSGQIFIILRRENGTVITTVSSSALDASLLRTLPAGTYSIAVFNRTNASLSFGISIVAPSTPATENLPFSVTGTLSAWLWTDHTIRVTTVGVVFFGWVAPANDNKNFRLTQGNTSLVNETSSSRRKIHARNVTAGTYLMSLQNRAPDAQGWRLRAEKPALETSLPWSQSVTLGPRDYAVRSIELASAATITASMAGTATAKTIELYPSTLISSAESGTGMTTTLTRTSQAAGTYYLLFANDTDSSRTYTLSISTS